MKMSFYGMEKWMTIKLQKNIFLRFLLLFNLNPLCLALKQIKLLTDCRGGKIIGLTGSS